MNKYVYFLNAIHYCIWLNDMKFGDFMGKVADTIFSPVQKNLFTEKFRKKYNERKAKQQSEIDNFFYNKRNGYHIGWAHHWYGYFYSGYPAFFSFILVDMADKHFGNLNTIMFALLFALPIVVCYIPAYKAVFTKDRYLKYFKQFEKKDEHWHKKWRWITVAFCMGSVTFAFLGLYLAHILSLILY